MSHDLLHVLDGEAMPLHYVGLRCTGCMKSQCTTRKSLKHCNAKKFTKQGATATTSEASSNAIFHNTSPPCLPMGLCQSQYLVEQLPLHCDAWRTLEP